MVNRHPIIVWEPLQIIGGTTELRVLMPQNVFDIARRHARPLEIGPGTGSVCLLARDCRSKGAAIPGRRRLRLCPLLLLVLVPSQVTTAIGRDALFDNH
jgi:hypothetical protein